MFGDWRSGSEELLWRRIALLSVVVLVAVPQICVIVQQILTFFEENKGACSPGAYPYPSLGKVTLHHGIEHMQRHLS